MEDLAAHAPATPPEIPGGHDDPALLGSLLAATSGYSIVEVDSDDRIVSWSEGAHAMYGYSEEEAVGRLSGADLFAKDEVTSGTPERVRETAVQSGRFEGVVHRRRKNGSVFPARVIVVPRRGRRKEALGLLVFSFDVSEEETLHHQVEEARDYTRSLVESSLNAQIVMDTLGVITDVNRRFEELTGYPRDELVGTLCKTYFTEPERVEDGWRRILAEGRVADLTATVRSRAGAELPLSLNGSVFRGAHGEVRGTFVSATDATVHQRQEAEARSLRAQARALLDSSDEAVFVLREDRRISEVNPVAQRLLGMPREELVGSGFVANFSARETIDGAIVQALTSGEVRNVRVTETGLPGGPRDLEVSVFRVPAEGEVPASVLLRLRDVTEANRLSADVREAQNYARALVEAAPDPWVLVDPSFTVVDVNQQLVRISGFSREELLNTSFPERFADHKAAASAIRNALDHETTTGVDLVLRTKGGGEVNVALNAAVARDTKGRVRGVLATARDVTGARALEGQVREALNYNRSLIEAAPDALAAIDRSLTITDVNEQMTRIVGATRAQLIGSSLADYFSDPAVATEGLGNAIRQGGPSSFESTFRDRSGRTTEVSVKAAIYRDTSGTFRGVLVSLRSVAEQKELEHRLREAEAHSRRLIDFHTEVMFVTDPTGVITDVNQQSEMMTGLTREKLIGSAFRERFADPSSSDRALRTVLEHGRAENVELPLVTGEGVTRRASCNLAAIRDPEGGIRSILVAARDVTEQRKLEDQVRESERYYHSLIEASPDLLFAMDRGLVISDLNQRAADVSGYQRDQLVGSEFAALFSDPQAAADLVARARQGPPVLDQPLDLRTRSGKLLHTSASAAAVQDPLGKLERAFVSVHDDARRVRLESELRESQHYNRSLIEASPDPMVTIDPSLVVMDVNEQMVRITGRSREELVGSVFSELFTDMGHAAAGVKKTFAEGVVSGYDLILKAKSGRRHLVSFNAALFRDTEGNTRGVLAIARDITRQRKDEEDLRAAQSYAQSLLEAAPDALVVIAPDLAIQDANAQMTRLTGYSRAQLLERTLPDLCVDTAAVNLALRAGLKQGEFTNLDGFIKRRNGQKVPVSMNGAHVRDPSGTSRGFLVAARDVSEHRRLEDRLRDTQAYTRDLIDSAADLVIVTDALGSITDLNRQAEQFAEEPRERILGTKIQQHFTDPGKVESLLRRVAAEGRAAMSDLEFVSQAKTVTPMSGVAVTLKNTEGGMRGILLVGRDISEARRLQHELESANTELRTQFGQLQEANRLKSDFLAKMSHELRTPLNGVIGFAEFLLSPKGGELTSTQRDHVRDILNCGNHLLDLINDILDLSRMEAGRLELVPETFDPRRPIEEVLSVLRPMAEEKPVTVQTHISEKIPDLHHDQRRLKQILYNLVSNGVKFTEPGGRVDVTLAPHGERMVELRVKDTGIGIAKEDLPRLFRDFEQLSHGAARRYQGSGLGLSLTKRLVELAGGSIQVESEPGHGSTFTVLLPVQLPERKT